MIEISVFWLALVLCAVPFWRGEKLAGLLFLAYLTSVTVALVLNAAI